MATTVATFARKQQQKQQHQQQQQQQQHQHRHRQKQGRQSSESGGVAKEGREKERKTANRLVRRRRVCVFSGGVIAVLGKNIIAEKTKQNIT